MDFARLSLLVSALFVAVLVQSATAQAGKSGLGSNCTTPANCSSVTNATCVSKKCVCSAAFKVDGPKCAPKGLGDNCTDDADCGAVANSKCDKTTTHKCICRPSTHKADQGQCKPNVIGANCNSSNAATVCSLDNSVCAATNKCACKAGYYNLKDQCLKGLGSACDSGNGTFVCTAPNSTCDATKKQCVCKVGSVAEGVACPTALGKTCAAATECVSNAVCDTTTKKCACNDGYENANGLCAASSAEENRLAISILVASLLLTMRKLF